MGLFILIVLGWLIVSFPLAILVGNFVFVGYNEKPSTLSGDSHD